MYNDEKNYYSIKYSKSTISFRLNDSNEMTFDITFYENNFNICINEKLLELIEFILEKENITYISFHGKGKDQFIINDFNKIIFNIIHKSLTSDIILKNNDWLKRLRKDMRKTENPKFYKGDFYDFLKKETFYSDSVNGIHQYIQEIEAYIRLHVKQYPISPEYLKQNVELFYQRGAIVSVLDNIEKYTLFYNKKYI